MKKISLMISLLAIVPWAMAQVVQVTSIDKLDIPQSEETADVVAIAPQGDYVLLSSPSHKGLVKFDLATKRHTTLTEAEGAGYNVQITADGKNVVYREKTINDEHLVFTAVKQMNINTRQTTTLVAPTRELQAVAVEGATAMTVTNKKMNARALRGNATVTRPVISSEDLHLYLTINGETTLFAPNGTDVNYIWPSLSPDGKRVLYYVSGMGCFVCGIDGTNLIELGVLRASQWLNDDVVVGMRDEDDGMMVTASSIIAKTLTGTEQVLTSSNVIAMYPHATTAGDKIAFSTPDGEAYLIQLQK